MATVKKAQKGLTMKQLKMKYPDVDTTAKGDVRGSEISSGAPKKVLQKYNDTYNAFDRKYKGGSSDTKMSPAKIKKNKMGGKVKKAQTGITESGPLSKVPAAGAMRKTKMKERSADGNYMQKTVTRETPAGSKTSTKVRRTAQGVLRGAPKMNKYKMGGKMSKMSKKK